MLFVVLLAQWLVITPNSPKRVLFTRQYNMFHYDVKSSVF